MILRTSILIALTAVLLVSCTNSSDGGSCPENGTTLITGIESIRFFQAVESDTTSESAIYQVAGSPATIVADKLMIVVNTMAVLQQVSVNSKLSVIERIAGFIVPNAHALSCVAPYFESTQLLDDISITSNASLSPTYPVGSDLSPVFNVGKQEIASDVYRVSPDAIEIRAPDDRETLSDYLSAQPLVPLFVALTLNADNVIASQHVFTVTFTLADGTVFSAQSDVVSIQP